MTRPKSLEHTASGGVLLGGAAELATASPPFDPRTLPGGRDLLRNVPAAARVLITDAAVAILAELRGAPAPGELTRLAHVVWERIRAEVYDPDTGATIAALLSGPDFGSPLRAIEPVLAILAGARGLRATLETQKAAIEGQLARLGGVQ